MPKFLLASLLTIIIIASVTVPIFALDYNLGVTIGQYVKYGNFVGIGPGTESFNDYDWLKLQVTDISGKQATLLSNSQYKNGTEIPGNGSIAVWNIETGTEDGVPNTQGPIIAANLIQGDAIPPPNTYMVNKTETRKYLGVSRTVNILDVKLFTPDYNTSLTYVYDRASGMLLESTTQTTPQAESQPVISTISYSIIETNIFSSTPNPSSIFPEFTILLGSIILGILIIVLTAIIFSKRRKH